MKQKFYESPIVIIIAVIAIIAVLYFSSGSNLLSGLGSDRGNNGWYNAATQECWSTPTALNGGNQPGGVSCCFDQAGYQVRCDDAKKKLSNVQQVFAVYQPDYPNGTAAPGEFTVTHSIAIANPAVTGAVPLDKVWIESATWTSSPSNTNGNNALNSAYNRVEGINSTYAGGILVGGTQKNFPSMPIDLQTLDPSGTGTIYTLTMVAKSTAYGGMLNGSQTITKVMKVSKETIGFTVTMNWGA